MLILLALITIPSPLEAEQRLARMTMLYEEVCLRTFPDDKAVEALMVAQGARELTPDEVRVTMRDDPARGWDLKDGGGSIWIEFPPFHACSVRWNSPQIGDLGGYRAVAKSYENAAGGFRPIAPFETDQGDIHIHAEGEERTLPDKTTESLFIFEQHITDPQRRRAGETGVSLRFVHQFAPPTAGAYK